MNCGDFELRFQELIDRRQRPPIDAQMQTHLQACETCRHTWNAWNQIDSAIAASSPMTELSDADRFDCDDDQAQTLDPNRRGTVPRTARMTALAATLLVALGTLAWSNPSNSPLRVADEVATTDSIEVAEVSLGQTLQWWDSVRQTDWLDETMPTVRSVGQGVAPLGRSLRQAVTLLATAQARKPTAVDGEPRDNLLTLGDQTS